MHKSHAGKVKSEIRRNEIYGDKDPVITSFIGLGGLGAFKSNSQIDFVGYTPKNTYFGLIYEFDQPRDDLPNIDNIVAQSESLGAIPILIVHRQYCNKVHFYSHDGTKMKSLV